ncbi:MAG: DUF7342 family protein [Halohasta sp.]
MTGFDPNPSTEAVEAETEEWVRSQDTRNRVQAVVTGVREPIAAAEIAERAHCSTNAARKHCNEFTELGIVRRTETEGGYRYRRNDAYFEWRRANELAQQESVERLLEDLADLEARDEEFQRTFSAPTPEAVDIPEGATHDEIERRLSTLREWSTVRAEMARYTDAVRLARRSTDGLTA